MGDVGAVSRIGAENGVMGQWEKVSKMWEGESLVVNESKNPILLEDTVKSAHVGASTDIFGVKKSEEEGGWETIRGT